jgi:hypothetical protein
MGTEAAFAGVLVARIYTEQDLKSAQTILRILSRNLKGALVVVESDGDRLKPLCHDPVRHVYVNQDGFFCLSRLVNIGVLLAEAEAVLVSSWNVLSSWSTCMTALRTAVKTGGMCLLTEGGGHRMASDHSLSIKAVRAAACNPRGFLSEEDMSNRLLLTVNRRRFMHIGGFNENVRYVRPCLAELERRAEKLSVPLSYKKQSLLCLPSSAIPETHRGVDQGTLELGWVTNACAKDLEDAVQYWPLTPLV